MLKELCIRDFVIIEKEQLSFGTGLNVISGESGSGKSIVLQALELVLGGRSKSQFFRAGSDGWEIEALFDLSQIPRELRDQLPEMVEGDELVVHRSMNESGRGRIYLNGRICTLSLLQEVSANLMNICSQGQQQRLLNPQFHLSFLDSFAQLEPQLASYRELFEQWRVVSKKLEDLEERKRDAERRRIELVLIVEELSKLSISEGGRASLESEIRRHSNGQNILNLCGEASDLLNLEQGLLSSASDLELRLSKLAEMDSSTGELLSLAQSARISFDELEQSLRSYASTMELDEEALESCREQLAELARCERKYRMDEAGLISLLEQAKNELDELSDPLKEDGLREEKLRLEKGLQESAAVLSAARKKAAKSLAAQVVKELKELNMGAARFEPRLEPIEFSADGCDKLEFYFSANKGTELRPLQQIASGGELSRIMLVLKKVLREKSGVNVLIFDEVDSGISGQVARAVGLKLQELAQDSQVICITHLAQVASLAEHHFSVSKLSDRKKTISRVEKLVDEETRVEEIARMLSGYEVSRASRESARELLTSKRG